MMGTYLNLGPVKLRHTKRGWRAGIGPRWLRFWTGAGGDGVSTGAGPFSYYKPLRRKSRRS
jgi:hypothetical protein